MKKIIQFINEEGFEGVYAVTATTIFWILIGIKYLFIPSLSWWIIIFPLALPIYIFAIFVGIFLSLMIIVLPGVFLYEFLKKISN